MEDSNPRDFKSVQAEMRQARKIWLDTGKDSAYQDMNRLAAEAAKLANEAAAAIAKKHPGMRPRKITAAQVLRNGHLVGWGR